MVPCPATATFPDDANPGHNIDVQCEESKGHLGAHTALHRFCWSIAPLASGDTTPVNLWAALAAGRGHLR